MGILSKRLPKPLVWLIAGYLAVSFIFALFVTGGMVSDVIQSAELSITHVPQALATGLFMGLTWPFWLIVGPLFIPGW